MKVATFETDKGTIRVELFDDKTPKTVENFETLCGKEFYDGLSFHRVIENFMVQGGCPEGSGTGGPGYNIDAEFNDTPHLEGVLSMARSSDPNSAGSQFFICLGTQAFLDGQYTVFGRTADDDSMEVVRTIGALKTDSQDRPQSPATIETATVIATPIV